MMIMRDDDYDCCYDCCGDDYDCAVGDEDGDENGDDDDCAVGAKESLMFRANKTMYKP